MQVMGSGSRLFAQLVSAALVMVVLVAVTGSSSSSKPIERQRLYRPVEGNATRRIETLFSGIPQQGAVLGDPKAPVTLQFFGDLECEEARQFVLGALPFLVRRWVREGSLRIVYRAFQGETFWPDVYSHQQVALLAAGEQEKGWNYLDFFYHEQGPEFTRYATDHFLTAIAAEVPSLQMAQWRESRHKATLMRHLKRDRQAILQHSIRYAPAFLIGPTGGPPKPLRHFSLTESTAFDEAIEALLKA